MEYTITNEWWRDKMFKTKDNLVSTNISELCSCNINNYSFTNKDNFSLLKYNTITCERQSLKYKGP